MRFSIGFWNFNEKILIVLNEYKFDYTNNNEQDDYGLKYVSNEGWGLKCNSFKVQFPPPGTGCSIGYGVFDDSKTNLW